MVPLNSASPQSELSGHTPPTPPTTPPTPATLASRQAEYDAHLGLAQVTGLGPILTRRAIATLGSAAEVWQAPASRLAVIHRIGKNRAEKIRQQIDTLQQTDQIAAEKQRLRDAGATAILFDDPSFPPPLKLIDDPPPMLYVRGQLDPADTLALGVVGSRKCTAYGREQADRLSVMAAQAGLCIISGGALGIDGAAHRATLRAGGKTIAIIGSGLARPYPNDHIELFDQIVAAGGAVISETPMTAPPIAENFPRRNRIISGMSLGILVIEAALRSGALITARICAEEHNRELMAVPGRIDSPASAGCHRIIREGWATLVTSIADILNALGETGQQLTTLTSSTPSDQPTAPNLFEQNLTASQRAILEALDQPRTIDELTARTRLSPPAIQAEITLLQIRGLLETKRGKFTRKPH